jgi:predicted CXXCH cytochrome family protein
MRPAPLTCGSRVLRVARFTAGAPLIFTLFLACGNDIVYRDRQPFNPPADAASGLLGYYDANTKQTTCGNCHADYQKTWRETKHASAHATANAISAKTPACFTCHTVTAQGNSASSPAGHDAVQVPAYFDVQCESCHGPGLQHVEGVGRGQIIRPLAKLSMSGTGNCGDCHSGAHHQYVDQWRLSGHAVVSASRASNIASGCAGCHDGRKALERWGVKANYVERDQPTSYQPVACAVCHDPHGSGNPSQLRFSISSPDPEQNLCMQCHMRRNEPSVTQTSPHAPQGAVLLGTAGWRPPGFVYDTARIFGSHATTANPRLCAGCHVGKFTTQDKITGAFTVSASDHLMRPIPCLDATGQPTADKNCAYTATARSWQTCTQGCHGNAAAAANVFNTNRDLIRFLTDQLWIDSNRSGSLQAAPTDAGLLPTVRAMRPAEWSTTDNTITPAEGAEFNARLCGEYGQANSDNSKGAHNTFLCRALLQSTINYIRNYYGLPAASPAVQARIDASASEDLSGLQVSRTVTR